MSNNHRAFAFLPDTAAPTTQNSASQTTGTASLGFRGIVQQVKHVGFVTLLWLHCTDHRFIALPWLRLLQAHGQFSRSHSLVNSNNEDAVFLSRARRAVPNSDKKLHPR